VKVRFLQRIDAGWIVNAGEVRELSPDIFAWLQAIKPGSVVLEAEVAPVVADDPVELRQRKDPPGAPAEEPAAEPEPTVERDKQQRKRGAVEKTKRRR